MKEMENFQQLWQQHETAIRQQWQINANLLQKVNIDKVERKIKSLVQTKAWSLGLTLVLFSLLPWYVAGHWENPVLAISGCIVAGWVLSISYTQMRELQMLLELDYAASPLVLYRQLVQLRSSIIRFLRLAFWILPLHLAFTALFFDLLFGLDLLSIANQQWLFFQVLFSLIFMIPLTVWINNKLTPENADKKWMRSLLGGNGAQISHALEILEGIELLKK